MNKNLTKLITVSFLLNGLSTAAFAQDFTTPYVDPSQDCASEGMNNPEGKNYRYLYSRDCRVVHVLPPPSQPQNIKAKGLNLQACRALKSSRNTLESLEQSINDGHERIRKYEMALEKASPSESKVLQTKIKEQSERLAQYLKAQTDHDAKFEKLYVQTPGAEFAIYMDSGISQNDLNQLRGMNRSNLLHKRTIVEKTIGPDGREQVKTYDTVEESALRVAPISQSYFSFIYNVPADAGKNGGVISTNIPNLQYLDQPGAVGGVIHVKANGGVSGKVIMSLTTACDRVKADATGTLQLDENTDPFFTVNRTFFIQQMFSRGYKASLKVDKAVEQITKFTSQHTNQGFKKSTLFAPSIKADVHELLNFEWTTHYDDGKTDIESKVLEIKTAVAQRLVDNYIENLVKAGVLTAQPDKVVDPATGGYVDETRTANRCWTESDGGVSGFFGGRHRVCSDYTYVVKVWRDGMTDEEIQRSLKLNVDASDSMTVNSMAPFYFTTAFTK